MDNIEALKSVLCDPSGNACVGGTRDNKVINNSLLFIEKELQSLKKQLSEAREVISYYADEKTHLYIPVKDYPHHSGLYTNTDGGKRARQFLKNIDGG